MTIFSSNAIKARQDRLACRLEAFLNPTEMVVIFSGVPIQKPGGLDQTYEYLPHPEYFWLTGLRRPGGAMVYRKGEGWTSFVTPLDPAETIWEGRTDEIQGKDIRKLSDYISAQKMEMIYLGQLNYPMEYTQKAVSLHRRLQTQECINEERRPKDEEELNLMRKSAKFAFEGFQCIQSRMTAGVSERELQIAYEAEIFRHGSQGVPYDTIVGTGKNGAILHAHPSKQILSKGDFLLVDAGAQLYDYCVDVSRTFCVDRDMNSQQAAIYDIVKNAQDASIAKCRVGVSWVDVHRASATCIAEGLVELGILKGEIETLLETGAVGLFFPHGVGHMVGQRVRDVGENPLLESAHSCGVNIRVNLELKQGYVMTVEPGLYFIPTLLHDPLKKKQYQDFVSWSALESWTHLGGVRLEDDILITGQEPDNLTGFIPK